MFRVLIAIVLLSISASAQQTIDFPLQWSGDLRYRIAKSKESIDEERNYQQLRARLGLKVDIENDLILNLRLATGTSAISTNQTLGDSRDPGMSRRSFGLDLAYIDWKFLAPARLWLGRTPNPFWAPGKSQLIFDSDLAFEGLAAKWNPQWSSSQMFINLGAFIIAENYDTTARQDVVDTGLVGAQVGYAVETEWGTGTIHLAHQEYLNIQDKNITSIDKDARTDVYSSPFDRYKGNIVYRPEIAVANYYFQNKFVLRQLGLQWDYSWEPFRFSPFYDSVENTQADQLNRGREYGLQIHWGRAQISAAEIEKESESVIGAFTDSDANGGGTDNRGTRWSFGYHLSKNSQIFYTEFKAKRGVSTVEREFSASQLDFVLAF